MITRDRMLEAVRVFGECASKSDGDLVEALVATGFSSRESEFLVAFLPMAFGRVALENLGRPEFSETVSAETRRGAFVEIPLSVVPIYGAALDLAREIHMIGTGRLLQEQFSAVAGRSAEVNAASSLIDAGGSIDGAVSKTTLVRLSAEDLGYDRFSSRIWSLAYAWDSWLRNWLGNR
jgi:hypothetical protein